LWLARLWTVVRLVEIGPIIGLRRRRTPANCPAEADSPQGCSCPDARSLGDFLLVDSLADFRAEHSADCPYGFRLPEVVEAVPEEQ
jgi:hypothetical protein